MLRATCSVCGKTTKGGDDWAGRAAQCPKCQAPIYFPAAAAPPRLAAEAPQFGHQVIPEAVTPRPPARDTPQFGEQILPEAVGLPRDSSARRTSTAAPSFKALATVAKCYEIMGIIAGVITGLLCLLQLIMIVLRPATLLLGVINLVVIALSGALTVLFCYVVAEHIRLMLQIERNTRDTAEVLTDLVVALQSDK